MDEIEAVLVKNPAYDREWRIFFWLALIALVFNYSPIATELHEQAHMMLIDNPVRVNFDTVSGSGWTPAAYRAGYATQIAVCYLISTIALMVRLPLKRRENGMPFGILGAAVGGHIAVFGEVASTPVDDFLNIESIFGIPYQQSLIDLQTPFFIWMAILIAITGIGVFRSTWDWYETPSPYQLKPHLGERASFSDTP